MTALSPKVIEILKASKMKPSVEVALRETRIDLDVTTQDAERLHDVVGARVAWESALKLAAIELAEAVNDDVGSEGTNGSERWLKALAAYRAVREMKP